MVFDPDMIPDDPIGAAAGDSLQQCVIGPPDRPRQIGLEWKTSAVVGLARRVKESGDFSLMPILADALEEVGCDEVSVLAHCRADGMHLPGCWVIDLLVGETGPGSTPG